MPQVCNSDHRVDRMCIDNDSELGHFPVRFVVVLLLFFSLPLHLQLRANGGSDNDMNSKLVLLGLAILCAWALAEEVNTPKQASIAAATTDDDDDDDVDDDDDYDYEYGIEKKAGMKHKIKKHKLYLLGGGLAAFLALKIKIVLVVVAVIAVIGLTLKVFGALKYAGFLGGYECPVVHETVYPAGYSAVPPPSDHSSYGDDWSSTSYARSLVQNYIDTDFISHALTKLDMAEMIFSVLEMDDDQCRRRMVCEMDAKTRQIPFLDSAMQYFSHGFEKYRTKGKTEFKDCVKLYPECTDSKKMSKDRKRRSSSRGTHRKVYVTS